MDHREMMRLWHQPTFRGEPWEPECDRAHSASGVHDAEKAGRTFVHPLGRYGNPPWLGTLGGHARTPTPVQGVDAGQVGAVGTVQDPDYERALPSLAGLLERGGAWDAFNARRSWPLRLREESLIADRTQPATCVRRVASKPNNVRCAACERENMSTNATASDATHSRRGWRRAMYVQRLQPPSQAR